MNHKDKLEEECDVLVVHGADDDDAAAAVLEGLLSSVASVASAVVDFASGVLVVAASEVAFVEELSEAFVVASGSTELDAEDPEVVPAEETLAEEAEDALLVAVLPTLEALILLAASCIAEIVPSERLYDVGTPGWSSCIHGTVYPPTLI